MSREQGPANFRSAWGQCSRMLARTHTNASGISARNENAEGSGKKGLRNGPQPMSEQLKVPHEPVPARAPTRAGGQQCGGQGAKQPL